MSEQYQKSWFSRNWPWVLPVGCCSGCLVLIVLFVLGVGTAFFSVFSEFVDASPIEEVIQKAKENDKVVEYLGADIERDGMPFGNISIKNDSGEIDFTIPIKGTKGAGVLTVRGIRVEGNWVYEDLYITIKETQEHINLLEKEKILEEL